MDYKDHINNSIKDFTIYNLRDRVNYRLFSSVFHLKLLLAHINYFRQESEEILNNPFESNPVYLNFQKEISSILDSFVYHTSSIFDYMGTLINFISGDKKQDTFMWSQLIKSVRCKNNPFNKKLFADTINIVDKDFVTRLNDYRSLTIHRKPDYIGNTVNIPIGREGKIESNLIAGLYLINGFRELKELNKNFDITIEYAGFWIINKAIDNITDILFSIKNEINSSSKHFFPLVFKLDKENKKILNISTDFWHEKEYLEEKSLKTEI